MLVLAKLCDDEGLFEAAGAAMARGERRDGRAGCCGRCSSIAAATTAVLSLDATVVLLTPVVLATVRTTADARRARTLYATAHLANAASLLLPVSNLTNLLAFTAAGLSFTRFSAVDGRCRGWPRSRSSTWCSGWFFAAICADARPETPPPRRRSRRCSSSWCWG